MWAVLARTRCSALVSAQSCLLLVLQTLPIVSESTSVCFTGRTFTADVLCQEVHLDLAVTCGAFDTWGETCLLLWNLHVEARRDPINGVCTTRFDFGSMCRRSLTSRKAWNVHEGDLDSRSFWRQRLDTAEAISRLVPDSSKTGKHQNDSYDAHLALRNREWLALSSSPRHRNLQGVRW